MHFSYSFSLLLFLKKLLAINFLDLGTTLENLGARCLLEKKVNFVPCKDRGLVVISNFLGPTMEFWVKIRKQNALLSRYCAIDELEEFHKDRDLGLDRYIKNELGAYHTLPCSTIEI